MIDFDKLAKLLAIKAKELNIAMQARVGRNADVADLKTAFKKILEKEL